MLIICWLDTLQNDPGGVLLLDYVDYVGMSMGDSPDYANWGANTSYPYRNGVISPPKSSLAVCAPVLQLVNLNFTYSEFYNDLDSTCCYNDNILNINKQWTANSQPSLKTNQDRKLVFAKQHWVTFSVSTCSSLRSLQMPQCSVLKGQTPLLAWNAICRTSFNSLCCSAAGWAYQ